MAAALSLEQMLAERDDSEKKSAKMLMKSTVDKQLAGQHGQNNW